MNNVQKGKKMICNYKDMVPWDFPEMKSYISSDPQITLPNDQIYDIRSIQNDLMEGYDCSSLPKVNLCLEKLRSIIEQFCLPENHSFPESIISSDTINILLDYLRRNQNSSTSIGDKYPKFINNISRIMFFLSKDSPAYHQYFAVPYFSEILSNHAKTSKDFSLLLDLFLISNNILNNPNYSSIFHDFDLSTLPPLLQRIIQTDENELYVHEYLMELQMCICELIRLMTSHPLNAFSWKSAYDSILLILSNPNMNESMARHCSYILLNLVNNEGDAHEKIQISEEEQIDFSLFKQQCLAHHSIIEFVKDNCFGFHNILLFVYVKLVFILQEIPESLNIGVLIDVYYKMIHSESQYTDKDECYFINAIHNLINFDNKLCEEQVVLDFVAFIFNERTENYGFLAKKQSAHLIATFVSITPGIFFSLIQPQNFALFLENVLSFYDSNGFESLTDKLCLIGILKAVLAMHNCLSIQFPDMIKDLEGCESVGILKTLVSTILTSPDENETDELLVVAKAFSEIFHLSE